METQYEQIAQILRLTEDTNKLLHAMERRRKVAAFFRIIYIIAIIYASWWSYKQMLPYIDQMKSLIVQVQEMNKNVGDSKVNISPEVLKMLDKLPR